MEPGELDDLALARVLDGLDVEPDADDATRAAHQRATADLGAIARALGLIGDTLAEEPAAAAGAVSAVEPIAVEAAVAPASGVVVPLRRRPSRAVLAAAASIVLVAGLGTALVLRGGGGSSSNSATSAQPGESAVQSMNGMKMMAPAAPGSATAPVPAAAPAAGAPAAAASSSGSATTSGQVAAKAAPVGASAPDFTSAVGCARGILLAKVVSISGSGGTYKLVLSVQEWISPGSGPTSVTYPVGSAYAANDSSTTKLTAGQQRVFIVPHAATSQIRAYADSTSLRNRIAAAQQQNAGQSCG